MEEYKLFDAEYRLMELVWNLEPVNSTALARRCEAELGWKKSTVFNLIAAFAAMIWAWLGSSFGFTVEFIVALAMLVVILLLGLYIFKAAAGYKKDWTTE